MIEFENEQNIIVVDETVKSSIINAINRAAAMEKVNVPFEVTVTFTDNEKIHEINKKYRNVDRETDVLSFPMINFFRGFNNEIISDDDLNPENGNLILGDIIISVQKAVSQAEEFNHSFLREITYLSVHSILHLLGYDHEKDEDKIQMRQKEENVLSSMNLTRQGER